MKTKRRHELETNELADWLGQTYRSLLPYANYLFWGAVILGAVVVGTSWLLRSWRAPERQAAALLSAALTPRGFGITPDQELQSRQQDYQRVADEYPETVQGSWARLLAADSLRQEGMQSLTTDRDGALASLRRAEQQYEELVEQPTGIALLDERALLGRARALEALGELKEARRMYERLLQRHPPEEVTIEESFGQPEPLDRFLLRRFANDRPEDLLGAIRAGLVDVQQDGQWKPADRHLLVAAGMKLRVQFQGSHTLEAKQRLQSLNDDEVVRFYEWFETAKPPLVELPELPEKDSNDLEAPGEPPEEKGIVPQFEPEAPAPQEKGIVPQFESEAAAPQDSKTSPEPATAPPPPEQGDAPAAPMAPEAGEPRAGAPASTDPDPSAEAPEKPPQF